MLVFVLWALSLFMLTGDQATTANVIGKELGVDQVISDVFAKPKRVLH